MFADGGCPNFVSSLIQNTMAQIDHFTDTLKDEAIIVKPEEGQRLELHQGRITLKITSEMCNDQFGLYEITLAPGTVGARLHYHRYMDETFIVNKGTLHVQFPGREIAAPEGSIIYIPRFTPHGFANNSAADTIVTLMFNPGGHREGFFYGLYEVLSQQPVDQERFLQLYNKYDSYPVNA